MGTLQSELDKVMREWLEKIMVIQHEIINNYLISKGESPEHLNNLSRHPDLLKNENVKNFVKEIMDEHKLKIVEVEDKPITMLWGGDELLLKIDCGNLTMEWNKKYYKGGDK